MPSYSSACTSLLAAKLCHTSPHTDNTASFDTASLTIGTAQGLGRCKIVPFTETDRLGQECKIFWWAIQGPVGGACTNSARAGKPMAAAHARTNSNTIPSRLQMHLTRSLMQLIFALNRLGEAVILNGSGSYRGRGWTGIGSAHDALRQV